MDTVSALPTAHKQSQQHALVEKGKTNLPNPPLLPKVKKQKMNGQYKAVVKPAAKVQGEQKPVVLEGIKMSSQKVQYDTGYPVKNEKVVAQPTPCTKAKAAYVTQAPSVQNKYT